MKKIIVVIAFTVLFISLMSFAFAANGIQAQDGTGQYHDEVVAAGGQGGNAEDGTESEEQNQISTSNRNRGTLTQSQVQSITRDRNKLRINQNSSDCPYNCSCSGSTTTCQLQAGRQMTIQAGNSGNTIIQVSGIQAQTRVQLYKEDGKLYGQFQNNITRRILSPEQVQEKVQQRLQIMNCSCENIILNEDGTYDVETGIESRFLLLFRVREKVRLNYDAETGELLQQKNSWWGFLAKDIEEPILVGATCGTVSPTGRDECCQNRGYDIYDSEVEDCLFNE